MTRRFQDCTTITETERGFRDGLDLRGARQMERKAALANLLKGIEAQVYYSEHLVGDGQKMFVHAAKLNWEGIISKNADAPYRSDRNEAWLKIKAVQQGKFPVIGFVKDPSGVAALYLGKREGNDLGQGRHGLVPNRSSKIRKQLDTVVSPKSKLTKPIKKPKATWVEPSELDFGREGLLKAAGRDRERPQRRLRGSPAGRGVPERRQGHGLTARIRDKDRISSVLD